MTDLAGAGARGTRGAGIADLNVTVGGVGLPAAAQSDLVATEIVQDLRWPGTAALRFSGRGSRGEPTWSDSDLFPPGAPLTVTFGYVGAVGGVFTGEITALEVEVDGDEGFTFVVQAHDLRHRLLTGRRSRTFVGMRDDEIVKTIATAAGLSVTVQATTTSHEHVVQRNQSDLAFINERAERIGYDLSAEPPGPSPVGSLAASPFRFGPRRRPGPPTVVLSLDDGLVSFSARLTTVGRSRQAVVQGPDHRDPNLVISAVAPTRDRALDHVWSASTPAVVVRPVQSVQDARALAGGYAAAMAAGLTGRGRALGNPDIVAGALVRITGLGGYFSAAAYRVTSTMHIFDREGYSTEFEVVQEA